VMRATWSSPTWKRITPGPYPDGSVRLRSPPCPARSSPWTRRSRTLVPATAAPGAGAFPPFRAGPPVHVVTNHSRWTAAARHLVRAWWGRDPGWTLVMLSLSSLGSLFFRGGLVKKVVTGYSGDVFPNFTPNPWFSRAYLSGEVEVEHWSFLAFLQRLEAAARGLPAVTTRSVAVSSMETNEGFAVV